MKKSAHNDIQTSVIDDNITVCFDGITKTFEQWQRTGGVKNTVQNLLLPQKKTITALDNVSFSIRKGEFVAYAGPNGAGKSTTIKIISGMLLPRDGTVTVLRQSPAKNRITLMKKVGILFGNRTELWWDHPINQSFEWKREVWDIPKDQYEHTKAMVVELLDIGPLLNTFARELSLGQRMRCDLAMMLLHEPELILLDEPTLGLDVLAKRQMINFLKQLNRERGTTIIVTSHDMDDLEEMAQRILLVSHGKLAFDGNFEALRRFIGCKRILHLTCYTETPPIIPNTTYLSMDGGRFSYTFDSQSVRMTDILAELSHIEGIVDVAFEETPLESALADLFSTWKVTVK
jgi:ABC-2 type transport system ATP-binding protein